ncbi:RNA exonuclease 1 homolog [Amyelois transitella]|uniref:RNA exonuclease 1 homolog n=1 Tax=Amyelois transitella TaxID=680683 RepID=UPI0029905DD5|nr:RNA exonuclease 1 homolog [Amyelois transitella]
MLPSTGYFKGINCPFYDSGLCERPYCHFRHVKKESLCVNNDGIESGAILQKLVSAAVQKVLQQTDTNTTVNTTQLATVNVEDKSIVSCVQAASKITYNPTPISELNKISCTDTDNNEDNELRKRHIPVPYTPRKPASVPIKRPPDTNGSSKPFIYNPPPLKYSPGSAELVQIDPYTPKGTIESKDKYLPGTQSVEVQEYTPKETIQHSSNKQNYIPSDRSISKKKILEYKPVKINPKAATPSVTYQPTPRSQVPYFSSDEEEPDNKKRKISGDLNELDDLGPEFDILDQILDEEKQGDITLDKNKTKKETAHTAKENNRYKESSENKDKKLDGKKQNEIKESAKTSQSSKSRSDKSHKSSTHDREKSKHRSKSSDKTTQKSSSKEHNQDRSKDVKKKDDKYSKQKKDKSSEKKHNSSSNISDDKSKHKKYFSKDSDKHSRHSSSSKSKERHKDKNHKASKSSRESKEKHKKRKKDKVNDLSDSDNHYQESASLDLNEDELSVLSDSDEESRALECKRIFEEYVPEPVEKNNTDVENKVENEQENEYIPTKKRISRTGDKNIKVTPRAPIKPDYKVNAAQAMAERLQKVREFHASKNPPQVPDSSRIITKTDVNKILPNNTPSSGTTKIRIAHVPYASTMINAKKTIQPSISASKSEPSTSNSTIVQTIKKGAQRVAHIPNDKFIDRPGVLEPLASKIAANIRSTYLNMMIDECLKIYLSATDAYARAQHEELATSKKCSTVQIYKNSAVLTVSRLRKELQECNGVKKSGSDCITLQKLPNTISGKSNNTGSWSIENKNRKLIDTQEFSGPRLYDNIKKWILTEEQLRENGFPRPHPSGEKGRATIYSQNKQKPPKGLIRTCCRCKKDYTVDKKGFPAFKEECIYHPNNKYRVRGEARYQCCSQDGTSDGCCIAPSHVYEYVDYDNLRGYVTTLPPEVIRDDYGVYSLDCEMCYTTHGLDLTRVTVINSSCKVVYETLIKPLHPIIDYNTRYSGITEEHMAKVRTTLLEVQATLLTMFNSKTILIGHSLESDFKALKLVHETVIDTSVLFPHKMGPPYKRALRNLSSEYLKKIIQNSVEGHDSAEDATVCMELLHYKLKEDLKTR